MEAVRAERAVQTMTQIMPRAGLLVVVAGVRRWVVLLGGIRWASYAESPSSETEGPSTASTALAAHRFAYPRSRAVLRIFFGFAYPRSRAVLVENISLLI